MKRLFFILLAFQSIASYAQTFTITVKDAATKIPLQGASVTILNKDSAFVDSCQMITIDMGDRKKYYYASQIEGSSPYYYIQCEKAGYLPQVLKVDAADNIAPDAIMLDRKSVV